MSTAHDRAFFAQVTAVKAAANHREYVTSLEDHILQLEDELRAWQKLCRDLIRGNP